MKATHVILQSDRFECNWGEHPDIDPPPGRDFAQALRDQLSLVVVNTPRQQIGERSWEHANWFFWLQWKARVYQIQLEAIPGESTPTTWHVGVSQVRGLFRSVFGFRRGRFDVDDEFLSLVEAALQTVAGCGPVSWVTEDEAIAKLWGPKLGQRGDRESAT